MKKIFINFAFKDKNKMIMSTEISMNVLNEMRRQRKIIMVLNDVNVEEYINLDITEINIYDKSKWKNLSQEIQ